MARRFMTDAELVAAVKSAEQEAAKLHEAYEAAVAAAKPAQETYEAAERRYKHHSARSSAAASAKTGEAYAEMEAARAAYEPLKTAAHDAYRAHMRVDEHVRELRAWTSKEWYRVAAALEDGSRVAALTMPCSRAPGGVHSLGIGHTAGSTASAIVLHCHYCRASTAIPEAAAVRFLLEAVTGEAVRLELLAELPPLVSTVDE